jgi:hypothetical protein
MKMKKDVADMSNDELRKELGLDDDPAYQGNMSKKEIDSYLGEGFVQRVGDQFLAYVREQEKEQTEYDNAIKKKEIASSESFYELLDAMPKNLEKLQTILEGGTSHRANKINLSLGPDDWYADESAFGTESMNRIERFYLDVLEKKQHYSGNLEELRFLLGCYLGEAITVRLDAGWTHKPDQNQLDFEKPVVALWVGDGYGPLLDPFEVVEELTRNRIQGTFEAACNRLSTNQSNTSGQA